MKLFWLLLLGESQICSQNLGEWRASSLSCALVWDRHTHTHAWILFSVPECGKTIATSRKTNRPLSLQHWMYTYLYVCQGLLASLIPFSTSLYLLYWRPRANCFTTLSIKYNLSIFQSVEAIMNFYLAQALQIIGHQQKFSVVAKISIWQGPAIHFPTRHYNLQTHILWLEGDRRLIRAMSAPHWSGRRCCHLLDSSRLCFGGDQTRSTSNAAGLYGELLLMENCK